MYSIMNAVKFDGELNAHDAAIKCRDAANKLQSNILGFIAAINPLKTITNMAKRM